MTSDREFKDLQVVADKLALQELVQKYSRAIDRHDFALLRTLYHDDAIEEHGGMFSGPVSEYIDWLRGALTRNEATAHYVVNMLFEVDGDRAEGEIYKINYHRSPPPDPIEIVTGSRSHDRFERRDGIWRFSYRGIVIDWSNTRPVNPGAYAHFAANSPSGQPNETDLSYARLPLFPRGGVSGKRKARRAAAKDGYW
jgi:hypothetical protein